MKTFFFGLFGLILLTIGLSYMVETARPSSQEEGIVIQIEHIDCACCEYMLQNIVVERVAQCVDYEYYYKSPECKVIKGTDTPRKPTKCPTQALIGFENYEQPMTVSTFAYFTRV